MTPRLTRRLGAERELELSVVVGDAVTSTLGLGIQVGEPSNPSTRVIPEVHALGIQEVEVILLLLHIGDSAAGGSTSGAGLH